MSCLLDVPDAIDALRISYVVPVQPTKGQQLTQVKALCSLR